MDTTSVIVLSAATAAATALALTTLSKPTARAATTLTKRLTLWLSRHPLLFPEAAGPKSAPAKPISNGTTGSVSPDECRRDVWDVIMSEAAGMATSAMDVPGLEPCGAGLMRDFVQRSILSHGSLEDALGSYLAGKVASDHYPAARWRCVFTRAFKVGRTPGGVPLLESIRMDLQVIKERDPACPGFAHALLFFKGFLSLQAHRVAHWLWHNQGRPLASLIQCRISEVFGVDVHPAAWIGCGVMIDHATGVVIGETAVVGDGCTLLHGVTLGGTGKAGGDRHPKLGPRVLVGAGASILGNIRIGEGAKIGAAALVLSDIPAHATAVGCPAKVIGRSKEDNPASLLDQGCRSVKFFKLRRSYLCPFRKLAGDKGYLGYGELQTKLADYDIPAADVNQLFFDLDTDGDGQISEAEFADGFEKFRNTVKKRGNTALAKLSMCASSLPDYEFQVRQPSLRTPGP